MTNDNKKLIHVTVEIKFKDNPVVCPYVRLCHFASRRGSRRPHFRHKRARANNERANKRAHVGKIGEWNGTDGGDRVRG